MSSHPDPNPHSFPALPTIEHLHEHITYWATLWNIPTLTVHITYVDTLRKSAGRCRPATGDIRLNHPFLTTHPEELLPTLCHEAAHIAVFHLHGLQARSHGPEWLHLMRLAGQPENRTCTLDLIQHPGHKKTKTTILHRCPRCRYTHRSPSTRLRWVCPQCAERGETVPLEIAAVYRQEHEP